MKSSSSKSCPSVPLASAPPARTDEAMQMPDIPITTKEPASPAPEHPE